MSLKLFYDILSQPGRSVLMFARTTKIPFTPCPVAMRKFEHHTEEYVAINPFKRIPALQDGDFNLTESITIMKYLHQKFDCPDHWYPSSLQQRARVNEYLDWHHSYTRPPITDLFMKDVGYRMMTGEAPDYASLEPQVEKMEESLDSILGYFMKEKPFLCGDDISIADIFAVNEVIMVDPMACDSLEQRPQLKAWIERVRQRLDPEIFDDVCKVIFKFKNLKK